MSRLPLLAPGSLDAAQRALYDAIVQGPRSAGRPAGALTDASGGLVGPFNAWLYSPAIGAAVSQLGEALRFSSSLKPNLLEIAVLVVARDWSAQFEWWAHARLARRAGVAPEVISAIRERRDPPTGDPEELLVYRVARELLETRRLQDGSYRAAVDLLGEAGVVELLALLGYYSLVSMLLNSFAVAVPEGTPPPFLEPPIP